MDGLQILPLTQCNTKVGLAAGTTTTINTPGVPAGAAVYAIRSKLYSRAVGANLATPTLDAATGLAFPPIKASQGTVVVVGFDASGNLRAMQGTVAATDGAVAGGFALAPQFPVVPDWICPVGYIIAKADSTLSGTWTFGSSNLSGVSGMTYVFVDVAQIPDRPQFS